MFSKYSLTISAVMLLLTLMTSIVVLESVKGAVGLATPSLTGAIKLSAVSHNSSTAILISAWNTRLLFTRGADSPATLKRKY